LILISQKGRKREKRNYSFDLKKEKELYVTGRRVSFFLTEKSTTNNLKKKIKENKETIL